MHARSTTFILAVALVGATGAAFAIGGLLLLWLASGRAPLLDSPAEPVLYGVMAAVAFGFAGAAWLSAIDLWQGRARGWAGALVIAVIAVGGAVSALAEGGLQAPLVVGLALTLATFCSLLAAAPRSEVRLA